MIQTPCEYLDRDEVAAAYINGGLPPVELEAFELHLLGCAQCRGAVEQAAEIRSAFAQRARKRRYAAFAAAGVGAAAILAWVIVQPDAIQRLGRVEAPRLAVMEVRSNVDTAAEYAARGVTAYNAGEYGSAATWFRRAHSLNPQAGTMFYLASSLLMAGKPDSAIHAYRAVIESGNLTYSGEAHFYVAKAWLQLARTDSAAFHLGKAAQSAHPLRRPAGALLDSLRQLE